MKKDSKNKIDLRVIPPAKTHEDLLPVPGVSSEALQGFTAPFYRGKKILRMLRPDGFEVFFDMEPTRENALLNAIRASMLEPEKVIAFVALFRCSQIAQNYADKTGKDNILHLSYLVKMLPKKVQQKYKALQKQREE